MKFFDLELNDRLKNFSKLWAKDEDLEVIIKEYARFLQKNEKELVSKALDFSHKHKAKINFKKRLKKRRQMFAFFICLKFGFLLKCGDIISIS